MVWSVDSAGPKKPREARIRGGCTLAQLTNTIDRPCAWAMRPFCQTTLTTFIYHKFRSEFQGILKIGQQRSYRPACIRLTLTNGLFFCATV